MVRLPATAHALHNIPKVMIDLQMSFGHLLSVYDSAWRFDREGLDSSTTRLAYG
jgi:hypothetical protein